MTYTSSKYGLNIRYIAKFLLITVTKTSWITNYSNKANSPSDQTRYSKHKMSSNSTGGRLSQVLAMRALIIGKKHHFMSA